MLIHDVVAVGALDTELRVCRAFALLACATICRWLGTGWTSFARRLPCICNFALLEALGASHTKANEARRTRLTIRHLGARGAGRAAGARVALGGATARVLGVDDRGALAVFADDAELAERRTRAACAVGAI